MSTRAVIARITGEHTFEGRYHHWDGYPSGLGRTLFNLYNTQFEHDQPKMLHVLIDEHPAGWSTINGADFSQAAGYNEMAYTPCAICTRPYDAHFGKTRLRHPPKSELIQSNRPHCYCHGDRSDPEQLITEKDASACGCEYVYMFTESRKMLVLSSYCDDGRKMIGIAGWGDPDATWRVLATVDLDGPEPDWEAIEKSE